MCCLRSALISGYGVSLSKLLHRPCTYLTAGSREEVRQGGRLRRRPGLLLHARLEHVRTTFGDLLHVRRRKRSRTKWVTPNTIVLNTNSLNTEARDTQNSNNITCEKRDTYYARISKFHKDAINVQILRIQHIHNIRIHFKARESPRFVPSRVWEASQGRYQRIHSPLSTYISYTQRSYTLSLRNYYLW